MSDDRTDVESVESVEAVESAGQTPARPTPNPASRARRIGGRPTPRPAPSPRPATADDRPSTLDESVPAASPGPRVSTRKPAKLERADKRRPEPRPEPTVATKPSEAGARRSTRSVPLRWIPAGVLALAAIVLVVLVAIASHGVYWARSDDSAGARTARQEQVLAAAKQCFAQVTSYDYRKLTGLVARDTSCTTGKFRTDLTKSIKTQIIPQAPKVKAVQTAQVNRAAIVSVSANGNQVVVLLFAQLSQSNSSTASKTPRIDVLGAVATLNKVGDTWLISNLDTDVGNGLIQ